MISAWWMLLMDKVDLIQDTYGGTSLEKSFLVIYLNLKATSLQHYDAEVNNV